MPFGIVDETKPGFVKVNLGSEDYKTNWMPVVSPFSQKNKGQFVLDIGEQVFVVHERSRDGEIISEVCIGATYNELDTAPFDSSDSHGFQLEKTDTLILHGDETNAVRFDELESALNDLKDVLNGFIKQYNLHTHPVSGAVAGVTTMLQTSIVVKIMSLVKSTYIKLR